MMKQIRTWLNSATLISVLFIIGISVPAIIWLVSDKQDISEKEKRRLAQLPAISLDEKLITEFPKKFEAYFDDHFGLRSDLVDLSRAWQATAFNKSSIRRVIQGEQGWLFFDSSKSLYDHVGLIDLRDNVLSDWKQNLVNKKAWLNNLGIEYLFVPVPNKMTLYPERLPARVRRHAGSTMLDKLVVELQSGEPYENVVNLEPFLQALKQTGSEKLQAVIADDIPADELYFQQDSHWTTLGAFLSYQHIMEKLQSLLPELEPALRFDQLDPIRVDKQGDLARMGSIDKTEIHHRMTVIEPCSPEEPETVSSFKKTEAYQLKQKALPKKRGCAEKSLRAIVVNDSFGSYLQPFFAESFKEVIFMRSYDLVGLESFLREFKPDVYIDIRAERSVKYLLAPDKRLQKAVLDLQQKRP